MPSSTGTRCLWLRIVAFAISFFAALALTLLDPTGALSAAPAGQEIEACILPIQDITGDGLRDFSLSTPAARNGLAIVYLIAGRNEPIPSPLTLQYLRHNLAGVLRGPLALPFACPAAQVQLARGTGGPAKATRRSLVNRDIDEPVSYAMVDLEPLMPLISIGFSGVATAINTRGQVVGSFFYPEGERAFVYDSGELRDLGTLGGHISVGRGINNLGEIVGYSLTGVTDNFGFINEAFSSDGFAMRGLGRDWSAAAAINDAGQIVGEMRITPGVSLTHAFLYQEGTFTDLGSLPPLATSAFSTAHSINEAGQIVGYSNTFVSGTVFPERRYFANRAFVYELGSMRDLGSLGAQCIYNDEFGERCFEDSRANDINASGVIVGVSSTPTSPRGHAFLWNGQELQDLGALGGTASWAFAVNDSGQVVGAFSPDNREIRPFLYERGRMHDLNDLIVNPSASMPFAAHDINNFGQIVGSHHVLNPLYPHVAPGRAVTFTSTLGQSFAFAYWVSRRDGSACHATTSRLRIQVRFKVPRESAGMWIPADVVRGCGDSTDWKGLSVEIPARLQGTDGVVQIRVREIGPDTGTSVFLRHLSMK